MLQILFNVLPGLWSLWKKVLAYMYLGIFMGKLSSHSNIFQHIGLIMRPLVRQGNLPDECAAPVTLSLLGQVTSYSMLAELNKSGRLDSRQVIVSTLVSALPNGVYNTLFFISPAALTSLGLYTGSVYLSIYLSISLAISVAGLLYGKTMLQQSGIASGGEPVPGVSPRFSPGERLVTAFKQAFPPFFRAAAVFIPATIIVSLLLELEFVQLFLGQVEPAARQVGLPAPAIIIVVTGVMSTIGALGVAGPILGSGIITPLEAIAALLVAMIFHFIYGFFSHLLPINISIFGSRLGWQVSAINLAAKVFSLILVIGLVVTINLAGGPRF